MSKSNSAQRGQRLPLTVIRQIDALCDEYEAALAANCAPDVEPYISRVEAIGRDQLLEELCSLAAEHFRSKGETNIAGAILAANPNLRAELEPLIKDIVSADYTQLFEPHLSDAPPGNSTPRRKLSRGLHIRCPHCSNPVEMIADTPYDMINCSCCGSNFSLVDRSAATGIAAPLQKINRFDLIARLGVGGFGTVWKARDTELDRIVAVKIPRHGQLSPQETERFYREARAAAQLRHPNIVPVHEVGRKEDTVFIVSDLIRGVSLSSWLTARKPDPRETAALLIPIAEALDHAHNSGIVHRDLKPSNIMIDDVGQPHLMDFGLAKRDVDEITMTTDGQVIGTPAYMSPEQAGGNSQWVDRRSDVYSLGVILFELLTGELPFRGNAQMQVHQRMNDDAPNARTLNRHIPLDLATICAKCLERDPGGRYQSAKQVADELKHYLNNLPIKARPISRPARFLRWTKRNPLLATVAGLVLFLAIAGPSAALVIAGQRNRLKELVSEKNNVIVASHEALDNYVNENSQLKEELDVVAGHESPWRIWASARDKPLHQALIADLYKHSGPALKESLDKQSLTDLNKARALLALATMEELLDQKEESTKHLSNAIAELKQLLREHPGDKSIDEALGQAIDDYSRIGSIEKKTQDNLLEESRAIRQRLASDEPDNFERQIAWFDSELRSAGGLGQQKGSKALLALTTIQKSLASKWPTDTANIYRLTCFLADRVCPLENEPKRPPSRGNP